MLRNANILANPVVLGVGEQSSASGMALYSDFRYAIHIEFVLCHLAISVACLVLICALSSYSSYLLRPDDLGKDIGSLCFRACSSILPIHPKSVGPGGARVLTSYAGMVPGYGGSFGYHGAPRCDWGMRDPSDMCSKHGVSFPY